jgi:hypothetical protein
MDLAQVDAFWLRFQQLAPELARADDADAPVYDELLASLQRAHPKLWIEFANCREGSELTVTADGDRRWFDDAERVVARAPRVAGWTIHALKPRLGFPKEARWQDTTIAIADVYFDTLNNRSTGELLVRLFVSGLEEQHVPHAKAALMRALDHGLGERRFAEAVAYLEVRSLEHPSDDYMPLTDLEKYLDFRDRRAREAQESP